MVIFQREAEEMREVGSTHLNQGERRRRRRRRRENTSPQESFLGYNDLNTVAYNGLYSQDDSRLRMQGCQSVTSEFQNDESRNRSRYTETYSQADHTGLEGYGRHLGSQEGILDHSMDTYDYSQSEPIDTQNSSDSESLYSADNGLQNYGRYLGSSPERSDNSRSKYSPDFRQLEGFRLQDNCTRATDLSYSSINLSDYEGLGSYSQPSQDPDYIRFSREIGMESEDFANSYGYGGGLF